MLAIALAGTNAAYVVGPQPSKEGRFPDKPRFLTSRHRTDKGRTHVASPWHYRGNGRDFALAESMEIETIPASFEGIAPFMSLYGTHLSSLIW